MNIKYFAVICYTPHRRNKPAPEVIFAEGWDDEARAKATFAKCKKEFPEHQIALVRFESFRNERSLICAADILLPELLVRKGLAPKASPL
jgi:hypothetical protein